MKPPPLRTPPGGGKGGTHAHSRSRQKKRRGRFCAQKKKKGRKGKTSDPSPTHKKTEQERKEKGGRGAAHTWLLRLVRGGGKKIGSGEAGVHGGLLRSDEHAKRGWWRGEKPLPSLLAERVRGKEKKKKGSNGPIDGTFKKRKGIGRVPVSCCPRSHNRGKRDPQGGKKKKKAETGATQNRHDRLSEKKKRGQLRF